MAISTEVRRQQVLHYLQSHADEWVDGPNLASPEVGGSEGLRRVRELRAGDPSRGIPSHRIITRPHPDRTRDIFQYKLVTPESVNPVLQARLQEAVFVDAVCPRCGVTSYVPLPATCVLGHEPTAMVARTDLAPKPAPEPAPLTPGMAGQEFLLRRTEDGTFELTKEVCVDCGGVYDDDLEHRTTDKRHLRWEAAQQATGQMTVGVPEQPPPYKFTKMPERVDMGTMMVCPRCKGHRRQGRTWYSKKQLKTIVDPPEDFTRDPFKPTIKGEPNPCTRCGGFGIIPQHVEVPTETDDTPLLYQPPNTEEQG